jgi:phosphatidate cytidylyltransferase
MDNELKLRIISAIVLVAITLYSVWIGGAVFALLVIIAGLLIFYEWSTIIKTEPSLTFLGWATLIISFALLFFDLVPQALIALIIGALVTAFMGYRKNSDVWVAGGILYAGLPVIAFAELRGEGIMGLFAITFIFVVVWATDIFAYFCGKSMGGPKLAPSISPGKTWSGAIFGLAAGVGAGLFTVLMLREGGGLYLPIIAILLSVSSQVGDLFESWIKRRFGVKDSSQLIPGHGGVMDRLDGVVFAAVTAFVIAMFAQYYGGSQSSDVIAMHLLGL